MVFHYISGPGSYINQFDAEGPMGTSFPPVVQVEEVPFRSGGVHRRTENGTDIATYLADTRAGAGYKRVVVVRDATEPYFPGALWVRTG